MNDALPHKYEGRVYLGKVAVFLPLCRPSRPVPSSAASDAERSPGRRPARPAAAQSRPAPARQAAPPCLPSRLQGSALDSRLSDQVHAENTPAKWQLLLVPLKCCDVCPISAREACEKKDRSDLHQGNLPASILSPVSPVNFSGAPFHLCPHICVGTVSGLGGCVPCHVCHRRSQTPAASAARQSHAVN